MQDLFGNEIKTKDLVTSSKGGTRRSVLAHRAFTNLYGKTEGKKCHECKHFFFNSYSRKYPKCALSGLMGATSNHDWSSWWQACGKFEPKKDLDQP
jgi:hypothetical protein